MLLVYVLWSLYIIKETKFTLLYLIILSQVKYKNHTNTGGSGALTFEQW